MDQNANQIAMFLYLSSNIARVHSKQCIPRQYCMFGLDNMCEPGMSSPPLLWLPINSDINIYLFKEALMHPATKQNAPKIAYLIKCFPRLSETFILHEVLELEQQGLPLRIY